jgi:hypothetical protein
MRAQKSLYIAAVATLLGSVPAMAQQLASNVNGGTAPDPDSTSASAPAAHGAAPAVSFEPAKDVADFAGVKLTLGGAFTQTFQDLHHSNTAIPADNTTLGKIRAGANLAMANLGLNVQLAKGINVRVDSYMSSRHHNEFWVKGGYAQLDASPINAPLLNAIMEHTTIRAGMFAPAYGDAQYRRSDGGFTTSNPFVENLILDAFTTEPGIDANVRFGNAFVMAGVTTGENKGDINEPANGLRARPAFVGKIGYDREVGPALRYRLSGSVYRVSETPGATLFWGDRTGSNYFGVLETQAQLADTKAPAWNGRVNPAFTNSLTAFQINPFVKLGGLELFGVVEHAAGKPAAQEQDNKVNQYAGDAVYRFLGSRLYVAGRYNVVKGDLNATTHDITVDRAALAGGWYITPGMLTKVEYVHQSYDGFPADNLFNGAKFSGVVVQGAITF